ncbi:MAG: orotidine-5'-phosphate decarboxylase [Deltaproteobacteria bacterium]|nr:orotidine-5'-phosphate decarboxylase [Deltaproteobacteria bacterium]
MVSHVGAIKIGFELFVSEGPALVERFVADGHRVFLDLKFHDIPNTIAQAVRAAKRLRVWMTNVHASGGGDMMRAAAEAARDEAAKCGQTAPLVIAVTVLTSLADSDLARIGMAGTSDDAAARLAMAAREAGLDGVVCSAREAARIKREAGNDFLCVTPGIRPPWSQAGDQKRTVTPAEALAAGADYLVVGRPITRADDPADAARRLLGS